MTLGTGARSSTRTCRYVRHPEYPEFLEEDWFFEALTETYVPARARAGRPARGRRRLPPHHDAVAAARCSMMTRRAARRAATTATSTAWSRWPSSEVDRTRTRGPALPRTWRASTSASSRDIRRIFRETYGSDLVRAFRKHRDAGKLEIITCGATHGFLPLMDTVPAGGAGAGADRRSRTTGSILGAIPRASGCPSAATCPGHERFLRGGGPALQLPRVARPDRRRTRGQRTACRAPDPLAGRHRVLRPRHGVVAPGVERGVGLSGRLRLPRVLQGRGLGAAARVPRATSCSDGLRKNVGLKYYRVTGQGGPAGTSSPTCASWALREGGAATPGTSCENRQSAGPAPRAAAMDRPPLVVSPYDAELFGHWWFEGPDFLNFLFRKMHFDQDVVKPITPSEYLERYPDVRGRAAARCARGAPTGYAEVWLNPGNDWIYPPPRRGGRAHGRAGAALRAPVAAGARAPSTRPPASCCSPSRPDWAFIMKTNTTVEYAKKRTRDHIARFTYLLPRARGEVQARRADPARVRGARQHLPRPRLPGV